jgi:hypothetical protein
MGDIKCAYIMFFAKRGEKRSLGDLVDMGGKY